MTYPRARNFDLTIKLLLAAVGLVAIIKAQSPAKHTEIEVATVKLNTGGGRGGMRVNPGRFIVNNTSLRTMIRNAYKVPDFTISGGPGWITSDRYDIEAKADGELKGDAVLMLLQTLLEDRFQLKIHRETKEGPVYVLTVAKGGSRLLPSNCAVVDPAYMPPPPAANETRPENCGVNKSGSNGPSRTLSVTGLKIEETNMGTATVPGLTFYLASMLGRPVVNKTGLSGRFDIHLEYTPDSPAAGLPRGQGTADDPNEPAPAADTGTPSIFTAMQEQLGLKLESAKGPVELLIIDHVERPSEN
jgi:uncharacterized protein (TIGR03435 family)